MLFEEMVQEFKAVSVHLNNSIIETKLQLLKGLDSIRRNCAVLKDIYEKKKKAIKKTLIREFIQTVTIPLCITSPSTRKNLQPKTGKVLVNTSEKIILVNQKECNHERFSFMKDLASKPY